jgi:hypothetical protein
MPKFSYGGWARRHPAAADALEIAMWHFEPWVFMAAGSFLLYAASHLKDWREPASSRELLAYSTSVSVLLLGGLLGVAMGSLTLSERLFATGSPGRRSFGRPVGQMVIASLVVEALAVGLVAVGLYVGASLNATAPDRPPLDTRTLAIGAGLFVAQGLAYPLYAWWRWSAERKP